MRLAVVSPFVDRRHGTERALAELLERLARTYRCDIHLYAESVDDVSLIDRGSAAASESGTIFWRKVPSVPGPQLVQFPCWMLLNSLCRSWDRLVHGTCFDLTLSPGVNCLHADVVIIHALFHRLRELAKERELGATVHNPLRRLHRRFYYALLTRLERRIYSNPKIALAAVSQRTASLLNDYFHRQDVAVIPNAVDTAQFSPSARLTLRAEARARRGFREDDFVLLLIGNDWRVKGLETLLRAASVLPALPLQILIVGSESPQLFQRFADELGVLRSCRFEPSRQEVLDFYGAADLYVSPTEEDAFALPPLEAMACGLPVITSTHNGGSQIITEDVDGFVLPDPHDSQRLARLLEELLHDRDRRQRVGEAAAKKAAEWTWDRNAAAVFQVLEKSVQRG